MGEAESYYDRRAKSYDELFDTLYFQIYDAVTWKYLEPHVPTSPDALVLDAGGGTGRWSIRMAQKGCKVVLLDSSDGMLEIACQKVKQKRLQDKIIIKKGDVTRTGYADESFDMILCEHVLFLFEKPTRVLEELRRVLKRKARLIVSVHNRYVQSLGFPQNPSPEDIDKALSILLCERHGSMTGDGKVKIYTWTPDEFRTMLEGSRLRVEKIIGKGFTMPLRISEAIMKRRFSKKLADRLLRFELALCERPDALALAGHLQAIVYKQ